VPDAPERDEAKRIARMQGCDFAALIFSIAGTWLALGFVLREALPLAGNGRVRLTLEISAAAAGIFATAALIAVLGHLRRNRAALYREDLSHRPKRHE
jgi:hypothetical protein